MEEVVLGERDDGNRVALAGGALWGDGIGEISTYPWRTSFIGGLNHGGQFRLGQVALSSIV